MEDVRLIALEKAIREKVDRWLSLKEIKDLGDFGSVFHDYSPDGFRAMTTSEKTLLKMCRQEVLSVFGDPK